MIIMIFVSRHRISITFTPHSPYRPLLPAGLLGYISYLHGAAVCSF